MVAFLQESGANACASPIETLSLKAKQQPDSWQGYGYQAIDKGAKK
jgi:hypothetical protein